MEKPYLSRNYTSCSHFVKVQTAFGGKSCCSQIHKVHTFVTDKKRMAVSFDNLHHFVE